MACSRTSIHGWNKQHKNRIRMKTLQKQRLLPPVSTACCEGLWACQSAYRQTSGRLVMHHDSKMIWWALHVAQKLGLLQLVRRNLGKSWKSAVEQVGIPAEIRPDVLPIQASSATAPAYIAAPSHTALLCTRPGAASQTACQLVPTVQCGTAP
jgi:hypothetical protein